MGDEKFESLVRWRAHCEVQAMRVLSGSLHLCKEGEELSPPELQKKKDYFLYKYYEFNYERADDLINKIIKLGE